MSDDGSVYPSVEVAYDFVIPSYQFMVARLEAADTRLTALLTLTSTLTLGIPIFAANVRPGISFMSPFFMIGVVLFVAGAVVGVIGRVSGSIQLPNPMKFYEQSLHFTQWEFKKNAIYFAGEGFIANADVIRTKGNIAMFVTVAWLLEVLSLVTWLAST